MASTVQPASGKFEIDSTPSIIAAFDGELRWLVPPPAEEASAVVEPASPDAISPGMAIVTGLAALAAALIALNHLPGL